MPGLTGDDSKELQHITHLLSEAQSRAEQLNTVERKIHLDEKPADMSSERYSALRVQARLERERLALQVASDNEFLARQENSSRTVERLRQSALFSQQMGGQTNASNYELIEEEFDGKCCCCVIS